MSIKHQDNYSTNLAIATSAGAVSSEVADAPSVEPPFYLAFDATNANSTYEIALITSKAGTTLGHAATTYDHAITEDVRMVCPARELDAIYQFPRGTMLNGKISVTVASSNLTVAIKTLADATPSVTDPVYIRIGDTVRALTSALSGTADAGTNYMQMGDAGLATREIDLFVYVGYDTTTSSFTINVARVPYATIFAEINHVGAAELGSLFSNPDDATPIEVVGRFAATLSAGAGYTWSVPTFTFKNLIQRPIYETRWLVWLPTYTGFSTAPTGTGNYMIDGKKLTISLNSGDGTSNATTFTYSVPLDAETTTIKFARTKDNGGWDGATHILGASGKSVSAYKDVSATALTNSGDKACQADFTYIIEEV